MRANPIAVSAARINDALANAAPTAPVRDLLGHRDLDAAYAVQQAVISQRVQSGRRVVGRKIGLTNPKVQAQLGVGQPDFGVLLDDMVRSDGGNVDIGRLLQPRIEAEVAFVLAADLDQTGPITAADVRAAVAYATPALEIVDSRILGWDISIVDTIADNASCGLYVLGAEQVPLDRFLPSEVEMILREDGLIVSTGTGADCLGDPLAAVAWLAETVRDHGMPLRATEVLLSGALGPMVTVQPGGTYTAEIFPLGKVTITFTEAGATREASGPTSAKETP